MNPAPAQSPLPDRHNSHATQVQELLELILCSAEQLHYAIDQLSEQTIPLTPHSNKSLPALSRTPFHLIRDIVTPLVSHLDSINDLHLLLAGSIEHSTVLKQLDTPHPTTAIKNLLNVSSTHASELHTTWKTTQTTPPPPPITPHLIARATGTTPQPGTTTDHTDANSDHPTGSEATPTDPSTPHSIQLTEHQQRHLTHLRAEEHHKQKEKQTLNNELLNTAVELNVVSRATTHAIISTAATLKEVAPATTQDVITETLAWMNTQYDEFRSTCTHAGSDPTLTSPLISIDESTQFVRTRVRELNKNASPALRREARSQRTFTIAAPNKDSMVPVYGLLTPEAAASLTALLAVHSTPSHTKTDKDTRTRAQRQADGITQITADATTHYRQKTNCTPSDPQALVTVAIDHDELKTLNQAAHLITHTLNHTTNTPLSNQQVKTSSNTSKNIPSAEPQTFNELKTLIHDILHSLEANKTLGTLCQIFAHQSPPNPDKFDLATGTSFYTREHLNPLAYPPGSIHPEHRKLIHKHIPTTNTQSSTPTSTERNQVYPQHNSDNDNTLPDNPALKHKDPTAVPQTSSQVLNLNTPEHYLAFHTALTILMTHTFETNTGISLTLDELHELGISDHYYTCEIHPNKATIISLQSQRRSGGPLFRAIKTLEQGLCAMPGSSIGAALCDLHHATAWAHGGSTDFDNLILVSKPHHVANDDTKENPNKGHFAFHPTTGIPGWKKPQNINPTGHIHPNHNPQALRAPARTIHAKRTQND